MINKKSPIPNNVLITEKHVCNRVTNPNFIGKEPRQMFTFFDDEANNWKSLAIWHGYGKCINTFWKKKDI
jgi:hypothetical protein